jgi:hypothetical protein
VGRLLVAAIPKIGACEVAWRLIDALPGNYTTAPRLPEAQL